MNMSYCRFQNTLTDLRDCYHTMAEYIDIEAMNLCEAEEKAMKRLIKLCKQITEHNGE